MNLNKSYKILVVEDDEISQFLLTKMLGDLGYESNIASNGVEALELLKNEVYGLVFMDMEMPILSGFETVQLIRNSENSILKNIPIIGISANPFESELDYYIKKGLNDYISKPISESNLREKLNNQLLS